MRSTFIDAGQMRAELSLQSAVLTDDGLGGHTATWQEVATLFGRIEPVSQASRFGAWQTLEENTHRIFMRHRSGVASGMRLVMLSATPVHVYDILAVHDPDESSRYLVCRVKEAGA